MYKKQIKYFNIYQNRFLRKLLIVACHLIHLHQSFRFIKYEDYAKIFNVEGELGDLGEIEQDILLTLGNIVYINSVDYTSKIISATEFSLPDKNIWQKELLFEQTNAILTYSKTFLQQESLMNIPNYFLAASAIKLASDKFKGTFSEENQTAIEKIKDYAINLMCSEDEKEDFLKIHSYIEKCMVVSESSF